MSSPLSGIPVDRRRRLSATLGLFAVLFVAVGAVAATGGTSTAVHVLSGTALVVAVFIGLVGWGVLRSVQIDLADANLDAAISTAVAARGGKDIGCDCGHDHDPDEMHLTDPELADGCAHDGTGRDCAHSCQTCVLAAMRPSPEQSRAERQAR